MAKVIGVKFRTSPKAYYFEAGEHEYSEGMHIIVETTRGLEVGILSMLPSEIAEDKIVQPLKPIVRIASKTDIAEVERLKEKEPETHRLVQEKINQSGLAMKIVDVEYTFDGIKLIIYFMSDGRVDFRDLVKELAITFKIRIELRQIGARDECRMIGGLAPCGRACCCSDHINDLAHVTIKMAKNQNLSLNPSKISGLCGRLMCCLQYENDTYAEINKRMPKLDSEIETSDGKVGKVVSLHHLRESATVRFIEDENASYVEIPIAELKKKVRENTQNRDSTTDKDNRKESASDRDSRKENANRDSRKENADKDSRKENADKDSRKENADKDSRKESNKQTAKRDEAADSENHTNQEEQEEQEEQELTDL